MTDPTALTYLEHLTDSDLALLGETGPLRRQPDRILERLARPETYEAVFGPGGADEPFLRASPFLTFAVAVHRAAEELGASTFTREWVAPRQRVPVFDAHVLRDFVGDPLRRLFLVELLASYTHVASGSVWVQTARGWRRRRFSELDPVRLASLLEVVDERDRPGVYRRLGDLALFLTGVFPDHTALHGLGGVGRSRLLRSGGLTDAEPGREAGGVSVLELLGPRWYRMAVRQVRGPLTGTMRATADMAAHFPDARRILNFVTDRFLFPFRSHWFGAGGD
ncbi:MAG: hypothetical protein E6G06_11555 [Actinobacteria bacterium]|nr:MAG: hypothetical protein E6G06_11555 [Actinomycetota bacterium]